MSQEALDQLAMGGKAPGRRGLATNRQVGASILEKESPFMER